MLSKQDDTQAPPSYKKPRLMDYKDLMNTSAKKGSRSLFFIAFFQSLSLKYHHLFSKKDIYLSIEEFLNPSNESFYRYWLLDTLAKKNGSYC
jgi:hypothetical protein